MILISVTQKGNQIGERLKEALEGLKVVTREDVVKEGLANITKQAMESYKTVIFVSSTGIAVRAIAPYIEDKRRDAAVIVIDSESTYVISLLSGHLGGANKAAEYIASYLDAIPVITTATDQMGITAPDIISREYNLEITDMKKCKEISVRLIEGEKVTFVDEGGKIPRPAGYVDETQGANYQVVVSNKAQIESADLYKQTLQLIRKDIVLGIGCMKDVPVEPMKEYILDTLEELNIHPLAIKKIVSVDLKKEEKAILELAKYLKVPFEVYTREEIAKVKEVFEGSEFVEKSIGVKGVCEPCVILTGAKVLKGKTKRSGMTLCVGRFI